MKKWLLHILLVGVLSMLTASCSQIINDPTLNDCKVEKEEVMIRFTIALDSPIKDSRSWEGYDPDVNPDSGEVGLEIENYINPNTVQVFVYDLSDVLIGVLDIVSLRPNNESIGKHIYDLIGGFEVDSDYITNNTLSFKLMVFANCEKLTNINNLSSKTFAYPLTDNAGIPMWGIATYQNVILYNTVTDAQSNPLSIPVYMLRSMAKIEVLLSEELIQDGYVLDGAVLNKAMNCGHILPNCKNEDGFIIDNLKATTSLSRENVFHPITDIGTNILSDLKVDGSNNFISIYVPEYEYDLNNSPLSISLNGLKKAKGEYWENVYKDNLPYTFIHGVYTEGKFISPSNLVRNHIYRYMITQINNKIQVGLTVSVYDWEKCYPDLEI